MFQATPFMPRTPDATYERRSASGYVLSWFQAFEDCTWSEARYAIVPRKGRVCFVKGSDEGIRGAYSYPMSQREQIEQGMIENGYTRTK